MLMHLAEKDGLWPGNFFWYDDKGSVLEKAMGGSDRLVAFHPTQRLPIALVE